MLKFVSAAALLVCALPMAAKAADRTLYLPLDQAVAAATASGKLNGSVKFYLAGAPVPGRITVVSPGAATNKKTNAFNKSDEQACIWAAQSALITLQEAALKVGANAVTNIASNYKSVERKDPKTYECHSGAIIGGVALKGDLSKVN